jgi:hypothetical protein
MARVSDVSSNRRLLLGGAMAAWLLFAASFLMPVMRNMSMVGWEACWGYLSEQLDVPNFWREVQREPLTILTCTFSWTNTTMFIAPAVLWRWPRWAGLLSFLLVLGGLVPCIYFHEGIGKGELRVGFYCWVSSMFLMASVGLWNWLWYRRNPSHL